MSSTVIASGTLFQMGFVYARSVLPHCARCFAFLNAASVMFRVSQSSANSPKFLGGGFRRFGAGFRFQALAFRSRMAEADKGRPGRRPRKR